MRGWAKFIKLSNHREIYLKIVLGRYLKAVQACIYIHVCLTHRLKKCLFGCFTFFLTLLFTKEFFEEHKNFCTIAKLLCPNWWNGYFSSYEFLMSTSDKMVEYSCIANYDCPWSPVTKFYLKIICLYVYHVLAWMPQIVHTD